MGSLLIDSIPDQSVCSLGEVVVLMGSRLSFLELLSLEGL
jgi:hypothetical protein